MAGFLTPAVVSAQGGHSVWGKGFVQEDMRSFAFAAASLPSGRTFGFALIDNRARQKTFLMSIECLAVDGNQAVLIGTIVWSTVPTDVGLPALFGVEDNDAGRRRSKPDRLTNVLGFVVGDDFNKDHTVDELCELAEDGTLIPIDDIEQALELEYSFPSLIELAFGDVAVR
jgi:hypothetical protein